MIKGDYPGVPGDPLQHAGIAAAPVKPFDPAKPGLGPFTPEQQAAITAYRPQQRAAHSTPRPTANPRGTATPRTNTRSPRGGAGGANGEAAFAPHDADRPVSFAQARAPLPINRTRPEMSDVPPEDMVDSGSVAGGAIQQTNNDALNKLAQTIPQPNSFDPAQLTVDVDVIAYDETAEPGKTYRYQMRYHILNPILGAINLVKNPAQAQKFSLASNPTDWTLPVDVPPAVTFSSPPAAWPVTRSSSTSTAGRTATSTAPPSRSSPATASGSPPRTASTTTPSGPSSTSAPGPTATSCSRTTKATRCVASSSSTRTAPSRRTSTPRPPPPRQPPPPPTPTALNPPAAGGLAGGAAPTPAR